MQCVFLVFWALALGPRKAADNSTQVGRSQDLLDVHWLQTCRPVFKPKSPGTTQSTKFQFLPHGKHTPSSSLRPTIGGAHSYHGCGTHGCYGNGRHWCVAVTQSVQRWRWLTFEFRRTQRSVGRWWMERVSCWQRKDNESNQFFADASEWNWGAVKKKGCNQLHVFWSDVNSIWKL